MNPNKETNNNPDTLSKAHKVVLLTMTILVALLTPVLLQGHLNVIFRNLFNPSGWIVLVPGLRVVSTLVCYGIAAAAGGTLLRIARKNTQALAYRSFLCADVPLDRLCGRSIIFSHRLILTLKN